MRIVVIGATGHIGTYLVPRLVEDGHDVIALSRGQRRPYRRDGAWQWVRLERCDREQEEREGSFGARLRALHPDAVLDLICFTEESARLAVEALRGDIQHFVHCGTLWVHGPTVEAPTSEGQPRRPFGDYGVRKAAIEAYLLDQARRHGFPATILHPGHIVGPGWVPVNPQGNSDTAVFHKLAVGEEVVLPDLGLATLHHVHADDVAQAFQAALQFRSQSAGESFHVASPAAITLRGYAEAVARWFGREANLRYLPWDEWRRDVTAQQAEATWSHIAHSPCASIAKAQRLITYTPRYTSLEGIREAMAWLIEQKVVDAPTLGPVSRAGA
ncbi:MAG: NAD(P)-dependent oxidoreductase [Chloroflexi bacterium]|nr:NAD(P)-dependent oxidoreductase [Chloroflexota bacterium]